MKVETFVKALGADFYTGVPDSQLKALCNYLMNTYGIDGKHHLIAANEGNAAALAAGITWLREKCRWYICRTAVREISSTRRHPF